MRRTGGPAAANQPRIRTELRAFLTGSKGGTACDTGNLPPAPMDFPLFCPKCKYTCVIRFKGGKIEEIKMPDA